MNTVHNSQNLPEGFDFGPIAAAYGSKGVLIAACPVSRNENGNLVKDEARFCLRGGPNGQDITSKPKLKTVKGYKIEVDSNNPDILIAKVYKKASGQAISSTEKKNS